jgi:integrase/recombinase XerD
MSTLITIFVRHAADCKHGANETFKKCDCRKHLRWFANGTQQRRQAGTRDWAEAEKVKRSIEDELSSSVAVIAEAPKTIGDAVKVFMQSKTVEDIGAKGLSRYTRELGRLQTFAERAGVYTVQGISKELLTGYAATWAAIYPSTTTRGLVAKLLKCFLRYCFQAQWIARIPSFPRIAVDEAPTEPLTEDEYTRLLAACRPVAHSKLKAVIQLMRHSGLAVRDAATLSRSEIEPAGAFYRVTTKRQKTGTHVSVPVPTAIAEEIVSVKNGNPEFLFWHGRGDGANFAMGYSAAISAAFDRAGISNVCFMKSHRLRDTFAVDLLQKGVPLEEVSKLLGHESIRTTEQHYARWVKGRQDRLDSLVTGTWAA